MADNEQQDDYLSNMLNALNEKEQESQSYNDPETIARQAKENLEAENAVKEANEPEREADADAKLEALLDNTPLEEAAEAKLTSDDNSELSDTASRIRKRIWNKYYLIPASSLSKLLTSCISSFTNFSALL